MPELVLLVAILALLVAAGAWLVGERLWARRLLVRRRVVVNLVGDRAVTGVLWVRRGGFLVLRDAKLLEPGAQPVAMDGDVLIERDRVEFVQAAS